MSVPLVPATVSHMVANFEQSTEEGRAKAHATLAALGRRSKVAQCLEMQAVLKDAVLDPKVSVKDKASLASAWDRLEDRIRILRDKPLPGSYSHEKIKRAKHQLGGLSGLSSLALDAAEPTDS